MSLCSSLSLLVVVGLGLGLVTLTWPCAAESALSMESESRPSRPKVFTSPEELRTYLEALSNYYAIAGRPRFGKRTASRPSKVPNYVLPLSSSNLYDLLQYDE